MTQLVTLTFNEFILNQLLRHCHQQSHQMMLQFTSEDNSQMLNVKTQNNIFTTRIQFQYKVLLFQVQVLSSLSTKALIIQVPNVPVEYQGLGCQILSTLQRNCKKRSKTYFAGQGLFLNNKIDTLTKHMGDNMLDFTFRK